MGMIADQLKARVNEMKARHAETDRELETLKRQARADFEALDASYAALIQELAD